MFGKRSNTRLAACLRPTIPASTVAAREYPDDGGRLAQPLGWTGGYLLSWLPRLASYAAAIAAFAERHTRQSAPARNSASRAARCDGLHWPRRDFSSIVIDCPRYQISTSGTPGLTPRFLRIAPLVTDGATGSVCGQDPAICPGAERVSPAPAIPRGVPRRGLTRFARVAAPALVPSGSRNAPLDGRRRAPLIAPLRSPP